MFHFESCTTTLQANSNSETIEWLLPYTGKFSYHFIYIHKFHELHKFCSVVKLIYAKMLPCHTFYVAHMDHSWKYFLRNNWNCHFCEILMTQIFPVYGISLHVSIRWKEKRYQLLITSLFSHNALPIIYVAKIYMYSKNAIKFMPLSNKCSTYMYLFKHSLCSWYKTVKFTIRLTQLF